MNIFKQWLKGLFKKKVATPNWMWTGEKIFHFQYKVSVPLSVGSSRDTGEMNISIPADSELEAKRKLRRHIHQKIEVEILKSEESK